MKHVAVQGLSFEFGSRLRLTVGGTRDVSPLIKPSNATNKIVTWTVGDPDIASVTEDGILTARATGKTRITARAGGRSAAFTLYVRSPHQVAVTITATGDVTIGGDRRSGSASLDHYEDLTASTTAISWTGYPKSSRAMTRSPWSTWKAV